MTCRKITIAVFLAVTATGLKPAGGGEIKLRLTGPGIEQMTVRQLEPLSKDEHLVFVPAFSLPGGLPHTEVTGCIKTDAKCVNDSGGHPVFKGSAIELILKHVVDQINTEFKAISKEQAELKTKVIQDISGVLSEDLQKKIATQAAAQARDELLQELRAQGVIP
jgi:hypothetical protein